MDLAFAAAVREAQEHPAVLSAEAKQSQARLQNAEKSLEGDTRGRALTSALAKLPGLMRAVWPINWNRRKSKSSWIRMMWITQSRN